MCLLCFRTVVKCNIAKSQALYSAQRGLKTNNAAVFKVGAIIINIPQHPATLHSMMVRSSHQLSKQISDLIRQPSNPWVESTQKHSLIYMILILMCCVFTLECYCWYDLWSVITAHPQIGKTHPPHSHLIKLQVLTKPQWRPMNIHSCLKDWRKNQLCWSLAPCWMGSLLVPPCCPRSRQNTRWAEWRAMGWLVWAMAHCSVV